MIITTKLHFTRSRAPVVMRRRLHERMDEGLQCKLTLITAPAGYGKTTLLSEWAMNIEIPVAWVSLDYGDNRRKSFWSHTVAALKLAHDSFDDQAVLRHMSDDVTGDSFMAAFINGVNRITQPIVLIWDDFHQIEDPSILEGVQYLIERLPSHMHLFIASRVALPLSLTRLKISSALNELHISDLSFNEDETSEFFAVCGGVHLSNEETTFVQQRTEGWAAAMRLAVLSLLDQGDVASLVRSMSGVHRDLSDYFFEEVLSRLSKPLQQFLLHTSILSRMKPSLCEAVTGESESETMLLHLEQSGLFLIPLDDQREWYRYHHLFQSFLISQLKLRDPHLWNQLHMSAARWLEDHGYSHEAVDHYLAAEGYHEALEILERIAPELMADDWTLLSAWLCEIPDSLLLQKPLLYLMKLAALYMTERVDEATQGYWHAHRLLEEGDVANDGDAGITLRCGLDFLAAIRTFMDREFDDAIHFSNEYVEGHPEGDLFVGFGCDQDGNHSLWNTYVSDQQPVLAKHVLPQLIDIWSRSQNIYFLAHLYIDIGRYYYEIDHLDLAEANMLQAYELASTHLNICLATTAELWLARIAAVQGEKLKADSIIQRLQEGCHGKQRLMTRISQMQVWLWKLQGEEQQVRRWIEEKDLRVQDEIPSTMIQEYEWLAMSLAEQGERSTALHLLERLIKIGYRTGRLGDQIRLRLSKSIILSDAGESSFSLEVLEEALALAHSGGYVRTIVDGGEPVGRLLEQYIESRHKYQRRPVHTVPLIYMKRLLRLIFPFGKTVDDAGIYEGRLPLLTPKEQEVLNLMRQDLTNREIALEMNVTLATIKTHINNIYGKLQTKDRIQALERARTFKLF